MAIVQALGKGLQQLLGSRSAVENMEEWRVPVLGLEYESSPTQVGFLFNTIQYTWENTSQIEQRWLKRSA